MYDYLIFLNLVPVNRGKFLLESEEENLPFKSLDVKNLKIRPMVDFSKELPLFINILKSMSKLPKMKLDIRVNFFFHNTYIHT